MYRDLSVRNKMPHILSCTARRVSAEGREGMWACACETQSAHGRMEGESRWRWRWSASEKEMTSLRKCWAGFHGYWMREVFSHSLPSLPLLLFSPLSLLRCTVQVVFPSLHGELMEGGLNILNFTFLLFFSLSLSSPCFLLSPFLFTFFFLVWLCISQVHTWPCFCCCSPHFRSVWHHAVFLGLVGWVALERASSLARTPYQADLLVRSVHLEESSPTVASQHPVAVRIIN